MCYNVSYLTRRQLTAAFYRNAPEDEIRELEEKWRQLQELERPYFHISGFAHPQLPVFTNKDPYTPQMFTWGLVPFWVKTRDDFKKIWNNTLNARGETIFEKPSFRAAAKSKRCLIAIDSFFEHHHLNGKTYPFNISMKDDTPMTLAGLWEEWVDRSTGEIVNTTTIVTCEANPVMTRIHNNPKAEGPRMPVIVPKELQDRWLMEIKTDADKKEVENMIRPYDEAELKCKPVGAILGKNASPNGPEALEEVDYPELEGLEVTK